MPTRQTVTKEMSSRRVFWYHFAQIAGLAVVSFIGLTIELIFSGIPKLTLGCYVGTLFATGVITAVVWYLYGGCPFTQLENEALKREGKTTYEGNCIPHYIRKWTGVVLPQWISIVGPFFLMITPIVVGIVLIIISR